jgi:two-component system sensor histidine kinase YesM
LGKSSKTKVNGILLYLLIAIVPTMILFGFYLSSLNKQMENEVVQTLQQTLNQAVISMESDLEDLKNVSDYLFVSASINEPMSVDAATQKVEDQVEELRQMNNTLGATLESSNVSSIRLYVNDEKIYAREKSHFFPFSEFLSDPQFTDVTARGEFMLTERNQFGTKEEYISFVRLVKDIKQVGHIVGALSVDLNREWFEDILNQINFSERSFVYLTDMQGHILLGDGQCGEISPLWDSPNFYLKEKGVFHIGKETYLTQQVNQASWYLVMEVPTEDLSASKNNGLHLILYIVLLMVFVGLSLTASWLVVNGMARRVHKLASVFAGVKTSPEREKKKFSFRLFSSLDESLESARVLIRTSYEQMELQRSTQLQLLQAQINPHFLYNTLDTIQWLVCAGRIQDSMAVIAALTRYLRLILNNGRDVVTVMEELEMTQAYIEIQKVRFGNTFDLDVITDPDVEECLLPKMTLQPIIENALLHGIRPLTERRGRIDIDIYLENGFLIMAVTDNGIGMKEEDANNLLKLPSRKTGGYGLYNVNQRILLFSDKEGSGIDLESEEGKYTMVTLRIAEQRNDKTQN